MQATDNVDEAWRPVAEAARECISLLGYPVVMLRCMPGEEVAGACNANIAMHACSYFAVLQAIIDEQIRHLTPPSAEFNRIYRQARTELNCPR
jgi:hypothetical protein